jgi:hypothetical protein
MRFNDHCDTIFNLWRMVTNSYHDIETKINETSCGPKVHTCASCCTKNIVGDIHEFFYKKRFLSPLSAFCIAVVSFISDK